ncbi:hypothetical protein BH23CHL5_BH23CHL5_13780 [soil metagenome]
MSTGSLAGTFDDDNILFADLDDLGDDFAFDVTCPGCDARLNNDALFARFRICPACSRHFWIPARERLNLIIDPDSFRETNAELVSVDPLTFRDALPSAESFGHRDMSSYSIGEALVTGIARIGGQDCVLVIVDFALIGEAIGVVAGEKIVLAIEQATSRRLPLIATCAGGSHLDKASVLSIVQLTRIAAACTRLQRNGVPFICVLAHPTTGTILSGFAAHANLMFAEPASRIGHVATHAAQSDRDKMQSTGIAEDLIGAGMLDGIVDRRNLRDHLVTLLDILTSRTLPRTPVSAEAPPVTSQSVADDAVAARHLDRPGPSDYVERLMPGFVELHGDRVGADEWAVRIGLGQLDGVSIGVVAVNGIASARLNGNGSSSSVNGYRKAIRLFRLASLLELPIVTFVDGLDRSHDAEPASSMLVAQLARTIASVPGPVVSIIVGESGGPHGVAFSMADRTLMMEHAVLSTSSPEFGRRPGAALRASGANGMLTSRECKRIGIVDGVIPEPSGGAHADPGHAAQQVRLAIGRSLGELSASGPRRLQDERLRKYRNVGVADHAGGEAVRLEIAHLQEIQRSVGRSIDELKDRIEHHHLSLPPRPRLPQRPASLNLPLPERPNLPSLRVPAVNRAEIADLATRLASTGRGLAERVSDARFSRGSESTQDDKSTRP